MSKKRRFTGMMFMLFVIMTGSLALDTLGYNPWWALVGVFMAVVAIGLDIIWTKRKMTAHNPNLGGSKL